MAKRKAIRNRKGLLPGESRRRSLVTVERVSRPGEVGDEGGLSTLDNYVVSTRRIDGDWSHEVELRGVQSHLPGRVIETINRHRESILKEERSRRARERIMAQVEAIAQAQG